MAEYRIFQDSAGEWRWTLYADNGEAVAQSEGYVTKEGAQRGAEDASAAATAAQQEAAEHNGTEETAA